MVFLACKKHFADIKRKLTNLGINGNEMNLILAYILGSQFTKE